MPTVGGGVTTIGFIGSGKIGSTVARLAVDAGHDVVVSNSRGPETLADLIGELGERARAATAAEAAAAGELVVVTIPFKAYVEVPPAPLVGKPVLDTLNYYPQRDGHVEALDDATTTSSELLQAHLPESGVVKVFNNINYRQLARWAVRPATATAPRSRSPVTTRRPRRPSPPSWTRSATTPTTSVRSPRAGASRSTPRRTVRRTRPTA